MKLVKMTNKEIEKLGGTYVKDTGWESTTITTGILNIEFIC